MSGPSTAQGPLEPQISIVPAKTLRSRFKSKLKRASKFFSCFRLSKSATTSTSTLATNSNDVKTSQRNVSSKSPLPGGSPQYLESKSIVEEDIEKLISRPIFELWDEAYDELAKKDKGLIADYEAELAKSLVGAVALSGTIFSGLGNIQKRQQMKALLEEKIKRVEEGEWKLKYKDHELAMKDLVEPVVGVIDWAKEFIGTALEPSPYGSIAWAGVCVLLPLILNPSKQEAVRVKALDDIASIISRCTMREALYQRRYESIGHSESKEEFATLHISYRDSLRALYVKILTFQATSVCFLSKNTFSRVAADTVEWNNWANMLAEIKEQEDILKSTEEQWRDMKFDQECSLQSDRHEQHMRGQSAIKDEASRICDIIKQARDNKEREKLLRWLSSVDPSTNYNSARKVHASSTGDWLIKESDDFKKWEKAPNSFLWLYGKAGSGKSFLSFSDTEKQNTENMLKSLIVQLCGGRPDTPKPLSDLHSYKDKNLQPDLEQLEETLQASAQDFASVYLVVDALDECSVGNEEREKLLKLLGCVHGWSLPNLHVLCTSRPEADIEAELRPLLSSPAASSVNLQRRHKEMNKDISTYIDQKFASSEFRSWPSATREEVKATLTEKADGMFQYIALQLDALKKTKSLTTISKALKDLPKGLDETYNRVLQNIDSYHQAQAIRSLTWLAFSMRPLTLNELAEASIIDSKSSPSFDMEGRYFSPEVVLDFLSSLVTVIDSRRRVFENQNEGNNSVKTSERGHYIVRLAHFSVKEYLISDRILNSQCSIYSIKETPANIFIAEACLVYLLQFDKPDSLNSETPKLPLAKYTARCWTEHAQWAGGGAIVVHELIMKFFLTKRDVYINWVRLFNPDSPYNEPDITKSSDKIASPLYYTSSTGLIKPVCQLLEKGADINAQGGIYGTALQAASFGGHDQIVKLLLEKGADVNAQGGYYSTALQAASYRRHDQIVKLLLENGAAVNEQGGKYGTALLAASFGGHDQIVKLLLEKGADINAQGGDYSTALQAASYGGHDQTVKLLLEKGADVNAQGGAFTTALHAASSMGHDQIVKLLLEKGADVNAQGGAFGTALQAASSRRHDQIVKLLLEKGADVNAQGGAFGTALQAASSRGHDQIVKLLLEKGADVKAQGGVDGTAFQATLSKRYNQIAQLLSHVGVDVNAQGGKYGTALLAASFGGHDQVVKLLLEHGADVNIQDKGGETALQVASTKGYDKIVKLLHEHIAKQTNSALQPTSPEIPS